MNGIILIGFFALSLLCFFISFIEDYNESEYRNVGFVLLFFAFIWLLAIPISVIESKTKAEYVKVFQQTIDENRKNPKEFDVLERTAIIEEINTCNMKITQWKVKGQKWYNNKWYYHPSTQKTEYVK
jgi:hypothetical protein